MIDRTFKSFLGSSLVVLQQERPAVYAQMVEALHGREVWIEADGTGLSLLPRRGALKLLVAAHKPAVEARVSRAALCELLEAEYTLPEAIYNDRVILRGHLDDLLAFYDALYLYFCGAVRCASFPAILDEYLSAPWVDSLERSSSAEFHRW